jgi:PKD repeat protein
LSGPATDDGLPSTNLSINWTKVSGPSSVVFTNASSLNATASFLSAGTYVLRLTVSDGSLTTASDVTITVTSCGTVVSGSVDVMADATDNVGVTGLQFKLDGVNLGPNFTAPPYTFMWNTLTAPNGCHVISAIAVDATGNQGSASFSVTVYNP